MTGTKLKLQGGGHSVRSFINMRDVAEGTLRAARRGQPGDIFHFATAETTSIRALVEEICRQLEVRFADVVEETEGRLGLDSAYLLDCEKARRELDWRPEIPLTQTIREMIAWMKEMWPEIQRLPTEYVHKP
jgi:dTDP-glucose 4,6-dehydratase